MNYYFFFETDFEIKKLKFLTLNFSNLNFEQLREHATFLDENISCVNIPSII